MKTYKLLLTAIICTFASTASHAQQAVILAAEPVILADATVGETNALIAAINKLRTDLGLAPLAVDMVLSARAGAAFSGLVNAPGMVDVTNLRKDFGASEVGVLRGVVTDRGAKSGGEFPKYWAKDQQWNSVMIADFTSMGAATAKRSDGKLVAFVYLIRK